MYNNISDEFLKDLQESILVERNKKVKPATKNYKPSNLKCTRCLYYIMTGTQPDPNTSPYFMEMLSQSGTDAHVRIQDAVAAMRENGFDCDYVNVADFVNEQKSKGLCQDIEIGQQMGNETHLYNTKYNISFLCDGIIRYKGEYHIIEFKTEGTKKWQARTDVNPEHINQAATYSLCLGLPDVIFVYINRDYSALKAYLLEVTDTMRERIVLKIDECERYLARGVVPPKPVGKKSELCQYCPYKMTCDSEEAKLQPLPF